MICADADVERLAASAVQRLKNFVNRSGEPETARQVVCSAQRQNLQRNPAVHDFPRSFVHRAVSSGRDDEVHWFFEPLFPAALFID